MLISIDLIDRKLLPSQSGIYIVRAPDQTVLYVGQSTNLRERWLKDRHHRYPQAVQHQAFLQYFVCSEPELEDTEKQMIALLKPLWNYTTSDRADETYPLGKKHWQVYESILDSPLVLTEEDISASRAIALLQSKSAIKSKSVNLRICLEEQGYYLVDGLFIKYLIKHRSCCLQRKLSASKLVFEIS